MRTILTTTFVGALCGAIIAPVVSTILLVILAVVSLGISGLWLGVSGGLYYSFFVARFFGLLPGAIIGAAIGCSQAITQPKPHTTQPNSNTGFRRFLYRYRTSITLIGAFVGVALSAFSLIYLFTSQIGVEQHVERQMQVFVGQQACANGQRSVYFVYIDYPTKADYICSTALASFLQDRTSEVLSVRFAVTYDFGKVHGYNIDSVGAIPAGAGLLQGDGGTGTGCLDPILPACDIPLPQQGSPW